MELFKFYGYETWMIFANKQKHKRMSQFHKLLHHSFISRFLMIFVKIGAFSIEILLMLIDHRSLWKRNTVEMAGGWHTHCVKLFSPQWLCYLIKNKFLHSQQVRCFWLLKLPLHTHPAHSLLFVCWKQILNRFFDSHPVQPTQPPHFGRPPFQRSGKTDSAY